MSERKPVDLRKPASTDLGGIFYPVGYIAVGFPEASDAEQVQRDLLGGGYDQQDCELYTDAEVIESARRNLQANTGFLATLGRSDEVLRTHLEAAEKRAAFLLIYAPNDIEASRAMNVIRRVPFAFAHRYHRFAIEELS